MMDLWELLVVQAFGSFWMAIFMMALIFFIIMVLGSISPYTALMYDSIFLFAMMVGYGVWILVVPIMIFIYFQLSKGFLSWFDAYYRGGQ